MPKRLSFLAGSFLWGVLVLGNGCSPATQRPLQIAEDAAQPDGMFSVDARRDTRVSPPDEGGLPDPIDSSPATDVTTPRDGASDRTSAADVATDGAQQGDRPATPDVAVEQPSPPAGCPAGAFVCTDFESGYPAGWSRDVINGALDVVTDRAVSGQKSLRAQVGVAKPSGAQALIPIAPAKDQFYGRVYMYIANAIPISGPGDGKNDHSKVLQASSGGGNYLLDCSPGTDGTKLACFNSRFTGAAVHGGLVKGNYKPAVDRWFCMEWRYNGPAGEIEYWFDGTRETSLSVSDNQWRTGSFNRFIIGWRILGGTDGPNYNVYYDDFVLSPNRVNCD